MKILYICTHNRCRSILCEAITNHIAGDTLQAKSAGSQPLGQVHPLSIKYLQEAGIETHGLTSQSWDEFETYEPNLVVTVCDSAAGESCPVWFGKSVKIHWGLNDPSKLEGSEDEKAAAFKECMSIISNRVKQIASLAHLAKDPDQLKAGLIQLGASE